MPNSHILLMVLYSLIVSLFFAFFWKNEKREIVRGFVKYFLYMVVGGIAFAWLMFLIPPR